MSMVLDEEPQDRFFTEKGKIDDDLVEDSAAVGGQSSDEESDGGSGDLGHQTCLTLRVLQKICPCLKARLKWDVSQGNIFQSEDDVTKRSKLLTVLEHRAFDVMLCFSALMSLFLYAFSEAFLNKSYILWGIIHIVNAIYTFCIFCQWLQILMRSKSDKTNYGYHTGDVVFSILSVIPIDIVAVVVSVITQTEGDDNSEKVDAITPVLSFSQLNYIFRIRSVHWFFCKIKHQLDVGDLKLFVARAFLGMMSLIHCCACAWHYTACRSFTLLDLKMQPEEATTEACSNPDHGARLPEDNWVIQLLKNTKSPLLHHNNWNVLLDHYFTSVYWAIVTCLKFGINDINSVLHVDNEIAFSAFTQIVAWIVLTAFISGYLTSLLVERDTEREKFLTRRYAIEKYLAFSEVSTKIHKEVNRFYDYFWTLCNGIHNSDMIKQIPLRMKLDIYFDINKFVLEKLPIIVGLDEKFLMSLSVAMIHNFYLKGEVLYRKGDTGGELYYVINGFLEVLNGEGTSVLAEIHSGSAIGEIFLMQSYPHLATVRCGSECDIMVLKKADFKKVLSLYPELQTTLLKRLDNRLEQSGLIIALCEKHNEYTKAFRKLKDLQVKNTRRASLSLYRQSFDMITGLLDTTGLDVVNTKDKRDSEGFEGLTQSPSAYRRMTKMPKLLEADSGFNKEQRAFLEKQAQEECSQALQSDVARAATLAKDLNIPRPPIIVSAPTNPDNQTLVGILPKIIRIVSDAAESQSLYYIFWKMFIAICGLTNTWFYTYQAAFGDNHGFTQYDYAFHVFDVIFLFDLSIDMLFTRINLLNKTIDKPRDILLYNSKTFYFWLRLFSSIPIEYGLVYLTGWHRDDPVHNLYYIMKFNRLIKYYEAIKFFKSFKKDQRVAPLYLFLLRFTIKLFFLMHLVACFFDIILSIDHERTPKVPELDRADMRYYEFVFYWAAQVVAGIGYGDMHLRSDLEIFVTVLGLILGVSMLIFLNARISSIMVNRERRRLSFKHVYFSLLSFMSDRKFPPWLIKKIKLYYEIQWKSHEGSLIYKEEKAIWDLPKALLETVCLTQAQKYVERIPLFNYCNEALILEICQALRQLFLPANQVVLYPSDPSRDLYIIVKGYCQVWNKDHSMGFLTEGKYFGLPGLIFDKNKPIKIETVTCCQLFCLEFNDYARIMNAFPKFQQENKIIRGEVNTINREFPVHPDDYEIPMPKLFQKSTESSIPQEENTFAQNPTNNEIPMPKQMEDGIFPKLLEQTIESSIPQEDNVFDNPAMSNQIPINPSVVNKNNKRKLNVLSFFFFPWTILPHGVFLKWWTVFRVICAICVTNFAPIQAAVSINPTTSFYVIFIFDIIAWIDIYLCFHIGYFEINGTLETDRTKTVLHYLKGPFLLDLIGCFPLDLIVIWTDPKIIPFGSQQTYNNNYPTVSFCRLNRMLQIYRIFASASILNQTIYRSLTFLALIQVVPLMYTFLNITTCIAIWGVCSPSRNGEPIECDTNSWIVTGTLFTDNLKWENTLNDPILTYIIGIYWIISTCFCVGFGDIGVINSHKNRKIAIAAIFFGTVVSCLLISKLTACLVEEDSRRTEIRNRTQIIFKFLKQFRVPRRLLRRLREVYNLEWEQTRNINPKDLFSALSPALRDDTFIFLYEETLRKNPLFNELDKLGIQTLGSKIKEIYVPEREWVYRSGDLDNDVFFVAKGIVGSYTDKGEFLDHLRAGSIVGDLSALFDVQRLFTAVAVTDLHLYVFSKEDFLDFLKLYPTFKENLNDACIHKYKLSLQGKDMEAITKAKEEELNEEVLQNVSVHNLEPEEIIKPSSVIEVQGNPGSENDIKDDVLGFQSSSGGSYYSKHQSHLRNNIQSKLSFKERLLSWFITYGRFPRTKMGFVHIIQEKNKFNWKNIVIHPGSKMCSHSSFWIILIALSCGLTSFEIAFWRHDEEENERNSWNLLILRLILEFFFIARIIVNFRFGYYDQSGVIVKDTKMIAKNYAENPFGLVLDLITTIPIYIFVRIIISYYIELNDDSYISTDLTGHIPFSHLATDFRSFQLFRLFLLPVYLSETESDLQLNTPFKRIGKLCILLCFIFHFCACALYMMACVGIACSVDSWMYNILNNLYENEKIQTHSEVTLLSRYLISVYYIATTITFTGLGDISPRTGVELTFIIVIIFITIFVIAFLIGEMTRCLASQVASKIHFKYKLETLVNHFRSLGLQEIKIADVRRYFQLIWLKSNGMSHASILDAIPYTLRADIMFNIYGKNIKNALIMGKRSDKITRQWCAKIKPEIIMPGTHIVRSGDPCNRVFFIKKGEVVVLEENLGVEYCEEVLFENNYWGEIKTILNDGDVFRYSYVARLETEIGVLSQQDLLEVARHHPRVYEDLLDKATQQKLGKEIIEQEEDNLPVRTLRSIKAIESEKIDSHTEVQIEKKEKSNKRSLFNLS